ncbi:spore protease YyaC [Aciduricibacillus chroicocephali]|uniref:Spore protease YyaC n=1 Tax=Aciduricibacillus chroicocephali TaxID=3054939 RepID=A0ABY9KYL4_9BACI|nr:spore protease YyaC [Bacillaceae bacterium 44XB]
MNTKRQINGSSHIRMLHDDTNLTELISNKVISWLPDTPCDYIVVFIGTDRSTGDALGPLAGTLFTERKPSNMTVYGTLHKPVHATNLEAYLKHIEETHYNPFIIAVDACLGKSSSVGCITAEHGPLKPGTALNKKLPDVGDIHLTGIVNMSGFMEYTVLQSTRLSIVMDMARKLADILEKVDESLARPPRFSAAIVQKMLAANRTAINESGLPPM